MTSTRREQQAPEKHHNTVRRAAIAGSGVLVAGLSLLGLAASRTRVAKRRSGPRTARRFDLRYREYARLPAGPRVRIRLIRPSDKPLIREGMRLASEQTRYHRFHVPKREFSDQELRYLTEIDGENHFAIGAERTGRRPQGLGIARFVRRSDEPTVAEAAIAVSDDVQHQGVGRILFERLMEAATERGIETLVCEVLAENKPALGFLRSLVPNASERPAGAVITLTLPLA